MLHEVKSYIEKRDLRMVLIAEKESIRDAANRQKEDLEQVIAEDIEVMRGKQMEEGNRIRLKAAALTEPLEQGIRDLEPEIQDIEQKIKYLKHQEKVEGKKPQFDDESVKAYRNKELVNLGVFYEDEFTIIKLFAAENDRPKNRWTLIAVGSTLLRELVDTPHEYGLSIHISPWKDIQKALKHLPTLEEIKAYIERNREKLMKVEGARYKEVKEAYLHAINNYSLEDFKPLLEPRKATPMNAPLMFRITGYDSTEEYRLYQGFYYRTGHPTTSTNPFDYIDVEGVLYARHCRPEQLRIRETGNTLFGNWWSIRILKDSQGHSVFNRENWDKTLSEATKRIDELNLVRGVKPISFNPPKVEWITPIPDEFFSTPKL